jgi:hypothetical protein
MAGSVHGACTFIIEFSERREKIDFEICSELSVSQSGLSVGRIV